MKTRWCVLLFVFSTIPLTFADEFAPTMLNLSVDPIIMYQFDGTPVDIPIEVRGTSCEVIFSLFTKYRTNEVGEVRNGYLGWHYVNRIDTCVYVSAPYQFDPGRHVITWDGRLQDGTPAPEWINYTYYLWGYDNTSERQVMTRYMSCGWGFDHFTNVQETDEQGLPLANPIWYTANERWLIGGDPEDETLKLATTITLPEYWYWKNEPLIDPVDFDYVYIGVHDSERLKGSIQKIKFVPGGEAEIVENWGGEAPYATLFDISEGGRTTGVVTDGDYLYTIGQNVYESDEPDAGCYIYDMNGVLVDTVDLTEWWSSPDDFELGGEMNGGPDNFTSRNGYIFLNSLSSCLVQMVDPQRYLMSGYTEDFFVWSNGNGDYVLDKNFEETAYLPWVCNDSNAPPYKYSIGVDDNLFSIVCTFMIGNVSFGLLGPDGTGLGHFSFADEDWNWKKGQTIIDSKTPYDGIYCEINLFEGYGKATSGYYFEPGGIGYIAHDSVKGTLGKFTDIFATDRWIGIKHPEEDARLTGGTKYVIYWLDAFLDSVAIDFSPDGCTTWERVADVIDKQTTYIYWFVPDISSEECYIRIADAADSSFYELTGPFAIESRTVVETESPRAFSLGRNRPNPFNPSTSIPFTLGADCRVVLTVYDITGAKVADLADDVFSAGRHEAIWNAARFPSGVYFYRLKAGAFEDTGKMTLVK